MKKLMIALVVVVLSVFVGSVVSADAKPAAKKKRVPTSLTINFSESNTTAIFSGKVKSPKSACEGGRKVSLIRKSNGAKIGSDISNNHGKWRIEKNAPVKAGHYFAEVAKAKHRRFVCRAAQSETITVPLLQATTSLTLQFAQGQSGGTFSGQVGSSRDECVAGRTVTVFNGSEQAIGSATSDASGNYTVTVAGQVPPGDYHAHTTKEQIDDTILCQAATSNTVTIAMHISPTTLTIGFTQDAYSSTFFGTVSSPNSDCEPGRVVTLFREQPGADQEIGHDTSDSQGNWAVVGGRNPTAGNYYASTPQTALNSAEGCGAAQSPTIAAP